MNKENQETIFLKFRLNACPICLICLDCKEKYGEKCTCQAREIKWKKKKVERDYVVNFCQKPLTQMGANRQKITLDSDFAKWILDRISLCIELSSIPNNVNICQKCVNEYRYINKGIFL